MRPITWWPEVGEKARAGWIGPAGLLVVWEIYGIVMRLSGRELDGRVRKLESRVGIWWGNCGDGGGYHRQSRPFTNARLLCEVLIEAII